MEFLLGRLLGDALLNLGIRETCREALKELNIDLEELEEFESDQGLGNGGLGRLAKMLSRFNGIFKYKLDMDVA